MLVSDVLRALTFDKAAGWDPTGLQFGDPQAEAKVIGVCHEVTERVVAESSGLDLLITYHPLLFKQQTRVIAGSGPGGRAHRLIRNGVSLAVIHTAWDAAPGGTADALAGALGLTNVVQLGLIEPAQRKKLVTFVPAEAVERVVAALVAAGAGTIGRYQGCSFRSEGIGAFVPGDGSSPTVGEVGDKREVPEVRLEMLLAPSGAGPAVSALLASHPYEEAAFDLVETVSNAGLIGRVGEHQGNLDELLDRIRQGLGTDPKVAGHHAKSNRVAVLPGSGGSFLAEAAASGAGVFVTGDLSHHQMVEAVDRGLVAIDVGHAASERPGVKALLGLVGKMVGDVIDLTYDPTPWHPTR